MSKKRETELKFKLAKLPDDLKDPYVIKQIYLYFEDQDIKNKVNNLFENTMIEWEKIKEVIIRAKVTMNTKKFFITLKIDGNSTRDEYEKILTESEYSEFSKMKYIGMIVKFRYDIPILGTSLVIEVDNYIVGLFGLITAEIEYDKDKYTENQIKEYADKYLGGDIIDITSDAKYKNINLATLNNIVQMKIPKE